VLINKVDYSKKDDKSRDMHDLFLLIFNFADENLRRLERRDVVLRNHNRSVLGDVARSLLGPLLDNEAAESTKIYVLLCNQRIFDGVHERLDSLLDSYFLNSRVLGNLVYDVCFCHFVIVI